MSELLSLIFDDFHWKKNINFKQNLILRKKKKRKFPQTQAACVNINRKHNENGYIFIYRFKQTKKIVTCKMWKWNDSNFLFFFWFDSVDI